MKQIFGSIVALGLILVSCESTERAAPPLTAQMATRARATQHIELNALERGRSLFVSRCIECHTLPSIAQHSAAAWPGLIDEMAQRASLKPEERQAVLAYILVVREQ